MVWQTHWVVSGKADKEDALELFSNGNWLNIKEYLIPPNVDKIEAMVVQCKQNIFVRMIILINGKEVWNDTLKSTNGGSASFTPLLVVSAGDKLSIRGNVYNCFLYGNKATTSILFNGFFQCQMTGISTYAYRITGQLMGYGGLAIMPFCPIVVDTKLTGMVVLMQNPMKLGLKIVVNIGATNTTTGIVEPVNSAILDVNMPATGQLYVPIQVGLLAKGGQCAYLSFVYMSATDIKVKSGKNYYIVHLLGN